MDRKASHALARKILDTLSSFLEDRGGVDELSLNFDAYSAVQLNSFLDRDSSDNQMLYMEPDKDLFDN